ncbi:intermembrane phospholipid transport protein YdbH family protein [Bowmanella yangjiangensis]|uniref:YdbH domain-containing protein n=1 Tax=Bowmanella yangjiangensis TaxID=2811230 RepID=A0ABS3CXF9_9ALTE|nr:YdbH domain-containing protein [Bowmanella yangjiangensis]MBN7821807.1 YdbH domain-containing protein [Bowmanella yangjiangensis]
MKAAFKWVSGILIAGLIIIALVYSFRHPLAFSLANHYLKPYQLSLDCLEFSLSRENGSWQIDAKQLCLSGPGFVLDGQQVIYASNSLQIAKLAITHQPSTAANKADQQPLRWQIPTLPSVSIAALNLQSPMLRQPLELAVHYDKGELRLDGPWQAAVALTDNQAQAQINWSLTSLADYFPIPDSLPPELLNTVIQSQVSFDGQFVTSQHNLALQIPYQHNVKDQRCLLLLAAQGTLGLSLDILSLQGQADLTALPLSIALQQCPLPYAMADAYKPEQLQINLPLPVAFSLQQLSTPRLHAEFKGNSAGQLRVTDLLWQQSGKLTGRYQLDSHLTPDARQAKLFPLAMQGMGDFALQFSAGQPQYQLTGQAWQVSAERWKDPDWQVDALKLNADFTYSSVQGGEVNAQAAVAAGHFKDNRFSNLSASLFGRSADLASVRGHLDLSVDKFVAPQGQANGLHHQHQFSLQDAVYSLTGTSQIKELQADKWKLADIGLSHTAAMPLTEPLQGTSSHSWQLSSGLHGTIEQVQEQIMLTLPAQSASKFTALARPLLPELTFTQGKFAGTAKYNLNNQVLMATLGIDSLSLSYQDYLVNDINLATEVNWHSGSLHLPPARLNIGSVNAGLEITDISGELMGDEQGMRVETLSGKVLDGTFLLPKAMLSDKPQQVTLHLKNLDAKQLASLGKDAGIEVRGRISADVPIQLADRHIEVQGGRLYNEGPAKLLIYDNQAFEDLLASQPTLAPSLSALKNMDISSVTSKVDLKPDGWLNLEMKIKGHNPGQKQDVNFNYSHEENLFTLFRALQLGDEVQKKVQEKIK